MDTLFFSFPIPDLAPDSLQSLTAQAGCTSAEARRYLKAVKKSRQKRSQEDWEIINYVDTCLARAASFLLTPPSENGEVTLWNRSGQWIFTKGLGGAEKLSPAQLIDLFEFLDRAFPQEHRLECSVYAAYRTVMRLKNHESQKGNLTNHRTIGQRSPIVRSLVRFWRWLSQG